MYQNPNIYQDPPQINSPTKQRSPQSENNSYTIDIDPAFGIETRTPQQLQPPLQPNYAAYSLSLSQPPIAQQQQQQQQQALSPLSYTTSPGMTSPGMSSPGMSSPGITSPGMTHPSYITTTTSNYVYQGSPTTAVNPYPTSYNSTPTTAVNPYPTNYNGSPINQQLPMIQTGTSVGYPMTSSPAMNPTTPRFSVPLPEHMKNTQIMSPINPQKPMGFGLPLSPQSPINPSYSPASPYNMAPQPSYQNSVPIPSSQSNFNQPSQHYNMK
jgi:hypothetical protein